MPKFDAIKEWLWFTWLTRQKLEETKPLEVYDDYQVANRLLEKFLDTGRF